MKKFNMAIYFAGKVVYTLEVETDSIESAREITWDNFIDVAYADENYHPCGDCAEYPDCKRNPKECEYSYDYEDGDEDERNSRLLYLLNKEKVCPLDKEERYELNELLNERGGN